MRRRPTDIETYVVTFERDHQTGVVTAEYWGLDHPSDSAAVCNYHRVDGPSVVMRDHATGVTYYECWYLNGKLHRENGPAVIRRSVKTGVVVKERWMRDGQAHRADGPAEIVRNPNSGAVTATRWWRDGQPLKRPRGVSSSLLSPSRTPT
jgi:hypothetical protein